MRITINNHPLDAPAGATILDAAKVLGVQIPTLCHRDGCTPGTSCMVCVVKVNGGRRMVPACATRITEGMEVDAESDEVRAARRMALELLLADHAGDCLAPCQNICPAHMDIPAMIRRISAGDLRGAVEVVKQAIPLPAALGRICPELCEKGCRRAAVDQAASICAMKRFVADADLASADPFLPPCRPPSGKKVAIVGSGPAGLAAAYFLLRQGHACVLLDAHDQPGGMLRYGVGEDRLPRAVLDAEIGLIERLGARFRLGTQLGRDASIEDLRREFDAVLIATGTVDRDRASAMGLAFGERGVRADHHTMVVDLPGDPGVPVVPGVFAAGGVIMPLRHAVRAVADGHAAAAAIGDYLAGRPIARIERAFSVHLGQLREGELGILKAGTSPAPRVSLSAGQGLTPEQAKAESDRCLRCDCAGHETCKLRRYAAEYGAEPHRYRMPRRGVEVVATHPNLVYEPGKCIACGLCVRIATQAGEPLGLTYVGRGFTLRIGVPFKGALADALLEAARDCAEACPTAALRWREARE